MKYLITGANGFLGKNLCDVFLNSDAVDNIEIATCGRSNIEWSPEHYFVDLADIRQVREMFLDCKPDVIFHLAGISNGRPNYQNTSDVWLNNICSTQNLAMCCPFGTKIILASSILVYGQTGIIPSEWDEANPKTPYAISKLAAEQILKSHINSGTIDGGILRFGPIVGGDMTHGVVKEIIDKLLNQHETIELIGPCPGNLRSYLWIKSAIQALIQSAERISGGDIINICNGDWISIEQLANTVSDVMDIKKEIVWTDNNWYGNPPILSANINKAKIKLDWKPFWDSTRSIEFAVYDNIHKEN